ncbi:nitroreductase family protein [Heliorestis convoluta]|uniref:Nitroreductase family protein n=1 Tax=Heliorestis convoluta TaxID=356322 RepID=A0A5Q2N1I1_9FIRM|nr:nitroreductase family protein [Heliorestis convoluta]QGG47446.1 nitroreductase family protein [Heliorestis convoluta]
MELQEAIRGRRSIRKYKPEEPPASLIASVLEEGLWAPSNMNTQPWHFVVVTGEKKEELRTVVGSSGEAILPKLERIFADKPKVIRFTLDFFRDLGQAPVLIFCYGPSDYLTPPPNLSEAERRLFEIERSTNLQSVSAAIQNILLAAHSVGLGTCWMTGPLHVTEEINARLGVENQELVAVITLGYPDQEPPAPKRKEGRISWLR